MSRRADAFPTDPEIPCNEEDTMLELTQAAKQRLHKSLTRSEAASDDGKCFRIVPKDDKNLTLTLARPADTDSTFSHEGQVILALPKVLQPLFDDRSLDVDEGGRITVS